jgi:hypothetical protein
LIGPPANSDEVVQTLTEAYTAGYKIEIHADSKVVKNGTEQDAVDGHILHIYYNPNSKMGGPTEYDCQTDEFSGKRRPAVVGLVHEIGEVNGFVQRVGNQDVRISNGCPVPYEVWHKIPNWDFQAIEYENRYRVKVGLDPRLVWVQ